MTCAATSESTCSFPTTGGISLNLFKQNRIGRGTPAASHPAPRGSAVPMESALDLRCGAFSIRCSRQRTIAPTTSTAAALLRRLCAATEPSKQSRSRTASGAANPAARVNGLAIRRCSCARRGRISFPPPNSVKAGETPLRSRGAPARESASSDSPVVDSIQQTASSAGGLPPGRARANLDETERRTP